MKALVRILGVALLVAVFPLTSANATVVSYHTDMLAANEPALLVPSTGFGSALVTFDDVSNILDVAVSFSGLTSNAVAGHIHCCAAPGTNAAVRVPFSFPAGTSGSFTQAFNLGGTVGGLALADFLAGLNGGLAYVNLHTPSNPGGEIRGQLVRVPEPASLALFGLGIAALGWATRKRAATRA